MDLAGAKRRLFVRLQTLYRRPTLGLLQKSKSPLINGQSRTNRAVVEMTALNLFGSAGGRPEILSKFAI